MGDSTFALYERGGKNAYLGSFAAGGRGTIDAVQESDGAQVLNTAVGGRFNRGLLVVHDGLNDPPLYVEDDGEIENANANFKLVRWEQVARALGLERGPQPVDPRAQGEMTSPVRGRRAR
jgi:myo-inositol-hexaphosphate 3-phosphohydrolase